MADITSNLVAHWKLDETSGTDAADSSGNGYTATYTNSPTLNQAGAFGASKAVAFVSTSNQCAATGAVPLLRNVSAATMTCWAKWATTSQRYLLSLFDGTNSTSRMAIAANHTSAGKVGAYAVAGDGETLQIVYGGSGLNNGAWHHIAAVVNYPLDTITVYVDGVAIGLTGTPAFTASATSNTDSRGMGIGAIYTGTNGTTCTLDDVRIYSRALSAADVAALYAYTGFLPFILDDCE